MKLDAGEIRLFDRVLTWGRTPPELGIVPQEIALYPLLTARENLEIFGRLQGLSGAGLSSNVQWALERTALVDRQNDPVEPVLRRHAAAIEHRVRSRP